MKDMAKEQASKPSSPASTLSGTGGEKTTRVQVVVRVRPHLDGEKERAASPVVVREQGKVDVEDVQRGGRTQTKEYVFDHALGGKGSQEECAKAVGVDEIASNALNGYACSIIAYGQTGSGKTHTVSGSGKHEGILPRAIRLLFQKASEEGYAISGAWCTCTEVYNEQVRDLLAGGADTKEARAVRFDSNQGFYIESQRYIPVEDAKGALEAHAEGEKHRSVRAHRLNEQSSRSHSLFTVLLETTPSGSHVRRRGSITLVDLAGSERLKEVDSTGTANASAETSSINKSLFVLGKVISAMALEPAKTKQGYPQATPYRESKLTMLLIDSLSSGKAALVANCSPLRSHAEETVQTLEFARKANAVKAKPRLHLDPQDQLIEDLRAQLSKCRKENQLLREALRKNGIPLPAGVGSVVPEDPEGEGEDQETPVSRQPKCSCFPRSRRK